MSVYLVVGGMGGIGSAVVRQLIDQGHQVIATYRNTSPTVHPQVQWLQWDVTTDFPVDVLPEVLDGVVYCPGSILLKPFHRIPPSTFIDDYTLQVGGAIRVLQAAHTTLKRSSTASVVLFSTVAVQRGFTFHSAVSASKGAIEGLVRALSAEWAPDIRINAIAPSITDTPLASSLLNTPEKREANAGRHPLKRIGNPDDIANAVVYLLSSTSSWMTGEILHVDGGMHAIK